MLITQKRPRVLQWFHAGPLLFGDWGTSRLYVLGLAFFYTAHASVFYLAMMSLLMAAVAWAYVVICRCFPDGGGVYTAARRINPLLSVIGATLLVCDYIVTAALSALEAFKYFGCPKGPGGIIILSLSVLSLIVLGVVNWFGARSAGRLALIVAIVSLAVSAVLAVAVLPLIPDGLRSISWGPSQPIWNRWESFVHIVLALAGLEAVANMTGLLKEPVDRTSKLTIWPVLIEVALLNLLFGIALNGLPSLADVAAPHAGAFSPGTAPPEVAAYRDTGMKVLATEQLGFWPGKISAIVFGLLLLSAANTAIMAIVSVLYAMAQDNELPRRLTRLNYSGVPWVPLIVAVVVPAVVLVIERDVEHLADLYAIGVCGAILINIMSCVANRSLPIKPWERRGMLAIGIIMIGIEVTIIVTKVHATIFAGLLVCLVLTLRQVRHAAAQREGPRLPEPATGWLGEIEGRPIEFDPNKPRIMLAARGRYQAEFAVDLARRRGGTLFVIYVRTLRVLDIAPGQAPDIRDDPQGMESLGTAAMLAKAAGVPFIPIYVLSTNIAEEILDYTATFGCDTLILGKTRRRPFARAIEGDVIAQVAQHLPDDVALITREPTPHPTSFGKALDGTHQV